VCVVNDGFLNDQPATGSSLCMSTNTSLMSSSADLCTAGPPRRMCRLFLPARASSFCPGIGKKLPRGGLSLVLLFSSLICTVLRRGLHALSSVPQRSHHKISFLSYNPTFQICIRVGDQRLGQCLSAPDALNGYFGRLLGVTEYPVTIFLLSYCLIEGLDLHNSDFPLWQKICREMQVSSRTLPQTDR
jgi:hypothetical protein